MSLTVFRRLSRLAYSMPSPFRRSVSHSLLTCRRAKPGGVRHEVTNDGGEHERSEPSRRREEMSDVRNDMTSRGDE